MAEFPLHGYTTSVDVYLDMSGGWSDDTRFDYSSAINQPNGSHRRDFIFNAGFYSAGDGTAPGAGSDRFIISASNNSGQPPFNPPALPIAITTTGWYTFEHRFYATGGNVLAVRSHHQGFLRNGGQHLDALRPLRRHRGHGRSQPLCLVPHQPVR